MTNTMTVALAEIQESELSDTTKTTVKEIFNVFDSIVNEVQKEFNLQWNISQAVESIINSKLQEIEVNE